MGSHDDVTLATKKKSSVAETKHGESASSSEVHWWAVAGGRGMSAGSIVHSCFWHEFVALVIDSPEQQPYTHLRHTLHLVLTAAEALCEKMWMLASLWWRVCTDHRWREQDTGLGLGLEIQAFTYNALVSDTPQRSLMANDCFFQRGICPGSKVSSLW